MSRLIVNNHVSLQEALGKVQLKMHMAMQILGVNFLMVPQLSLAIALAGLVSLILVSSGQRLLLPEGLVRIHLLQVAAVHLNH
jgi:hypothetical protein